MSYLSLLTVPSNIFGYQHILPNYAAFPISSDPLVWKFYDFKGILCHIRIETMLSCVVLFLFQNTFLDINTFFSIFNILRPTIFKILRFSRNSQSHLDRNNVEFHLFQKISLSINTFLSISNILKPTGYFAA